jgi:hypothetical protein
MTTVEANGVTLGVEHFGEAAAPLRQDFQEPTPGLEPGTPSLRGKDQ